MIINDVIKQMRYLSSNGIPFSFEFVSINQSTNKSNGVVQVDSALLRKGRQTNSPSLVAYTDLTTEEPKHFHLPLLTKFNGNLIRNEY